MGFGNWQAQGFWDPGLIILEISLCLFLLLWLSGYWLFWRHRQDFPISGRQPVMALATVSMSGLIIMVFLVECLLSGSDKVDPEAVCIVVAASGGLHPCVGLGYVLRFTRLLCDFRITDQTENWLAHQRRFTLTTAPGPASSQLGWWLTIQRRLTEPMMVAGLLAWLLFQVLMVTLYSRLPVLDPDTGRQGTSRACHQLEGLVQMTQAIECILLLLVVAPLARALGHSRQDVFGMKTEGLRVVAGSAVGLAVWAAVVLHFGKHALSDSWTAVVLAWVHTWLLLVTIWVPVVSAVQYSRDGAHHSIPDVEGGLLQFLENGKCTHYFMQYMASEFAVEHVLFLITLRKIPGGIGYKAVFGTDEPVAPRQRTSDARRSRHSGRPTLALPVSLSGTPRLGSPAPDSPLGGSRRLSPQERLGHLDTSALDRIDTPAATTVVVDLPADEEEPFPLAPPRPLVIADTEHLGEPRLSAEWASLDEEDQLLALGVVDVLMSCCINVDAMATINIGAALREEIQSAFDRFDRLRSQGQLDACAQAIPSMFAGAVCECTSLLAQPFHRFRQSVLYETMLKDNRPLSLILGLRSPRHSRPSHPRSPVSGTASTVHPNLIEMTQQLGTISYPDLSSEPADLLNLSPRNSYH